MKLRLSVQLRLTLLFGIAACFGSVLLGVISYSSLKRNAIRVIDDELKSRRDGVEDFLSEHIASVPSPRFQELLMQRAALKPGHLVVYQEPGILLYCGSAVRQLCASGITFRDRPFTAQDGLRILSAKGAVNQIQYRFAVITDLGFEKNVLNDFTHLLLFIIPGVVLVSMLGAYWLSGRTLKPVRDLIGEVHAIGEKNLSQRLQVQDTNDEIQVLSETVNGMLGRIDRAFQQVKEITANASHELRTPIAIIRAAAEVALLNARPTLASHTEALRQILLEAERNTVVLDSMLYLARIDSGHQDTKFVWINFEESVQHAVESCRGLADAKGVSLVVETECVPVQILGDPGALNRLWLILIDNAIKYAAGSPKVRILLRCRPGGAPVCEIVDAGIGIPSSDLPHIFERFYRSENARLTEAHGSGLGLAIAHWIVESHGATIDVKSIVKCGTIFQIAFTNFAFVNAEAVVPEQVVDSARAL